MRYIWASVGMIFTAIGFLFLFLGVHMLIGFYMPIEYVAPTFTANPFWSTVWAFVFAVVGIFGGLALVEGYVTKKY